MRLLLDTQALSWFLKDAPELSGVARDAVELEESEVFASAVSAWESAFKASIGKWPDASDLVDLLPSLVTRLDFRPLPINL